MGKKPASAKNSCISDYVRGNYNLSCPQCGGMNGIRVAGTYEHPKNPQNWFCHCTACKKSFNPRPKKEDSDVGTAEQTLPKDKYAEMMGKGMTDHMIANSMGLKLSSVKKLKRKYGLTVPGRVGRPKKEGDVKMPPYETHPEGKSNSGQVDNSELMDKTETLDPVYCGPEEPEKLSISKLIDLREMLNTEIECLEKVDTRINGIQLSPGVKSLITNHWDECQDKLDWINKVFDETTIDAPVQNL